MDKLFEGKSEGKKKKWQAEEKKKIVEKREDGEKVCRSENGLGTLAGRTTIRIRAWDDRTLMREGNI